MARSKRYQKMTDEQVLDLATTKLSDNDRYYLLQELECRKLRGEVKAKKIEKLKKSKRPKTIGGLIFIALFLVFSLSRLGSRMFGG